MNAPKQYFKEKRENNLKLFEGKQRFFAAIIQAFINTYNRRKNKIPEIDLFTFFRRDDLRKMELALCNGCSRVLDKQKDRNLLSESCICGSEKMIRCPYCQALQCCNDECAIGKPNTLMSKSISGLDETSHKTQYLPAQLRKIVHHLQSTLPSDLLDQAKNGLDTVQENLKNWHKKAPNKNTVHIHHLLNGTMHFFWRSQSGMKILGAILKVLRDDCTWNKHLIHDIVLFMNTLRSYCQENAQEGYGRLMILFGNNQLSSFLFMKRVVCAHDQCKKIMPGFEIADHILSLKLKCKRCNAITIFPCPDCGEFQCWSCREVHHVWKKMVERFRPHEVGNKPFTHVELDLKIFLIRMIEKSGIKVPWEKRAGTTATAKIASTQEVVNISLQHSGIIVPRLVGYNLFGFFEPFFERYEEEEPVFNSLNMKGANTSSRYLRQQDGVTPKGTLNHIGMERFYEKMKRSTPKQREELMLWLCERAMIPTVLLKQIQDAQMLIGEFESKLILSEDFCSECNVPLICINKETFCPQHKENWKEPEEVEGVPLNLMETSMLDLSKFRQSEAGGLGAVLNRFKEEKEKIDNEEEKQKIQEERIDSMTERKEHILEELRMDQCDLNHELLKDKKSMDIQTMRECLDSLEQCHNAQEVTEKMIDIVQRYRISTPFLVALNNKKTRCQINKGEGIIQPVKSNVIYPKHRGPVARVGIRIFDANDVECWKGSQGAKTDMDPQAEIDTRPPEYMEELENLLGGKETQQEQSQERSPQMDELNRDHPHLREVNEKGEVGDAKPIMPPDMHDQVIQRLSSTISSSNKTERMMKLVNGFIVSDELLRKIIEQKFTFKVDGAEDILNITGKKCPCGSYVVAVGETLFCSNNVLSWTPEMYITHPKSDQLAFTETTAGTEEEDPVEQFNSTLDVFEETPVMAAASSSHGTELNGLTESDSDDPLAGFVDELDDITAESDDALPAIKVNLLDDLGFDLSEVTDASVESKDDGLESSDETEDEEEPEEDEAATAFEEAKKEIAQQGSQQPQLNQKKATGKEMLGTDQWNQLQFVDVGSESNPQAVEPKSEATQFDNENNRTEEISQGAVQTSNITKSRIAGDSSVIMDPSRDPRLQEIQQAAQQKVNPSSEVQGVEKETNNLDDLFENEETSQLETADVSAKDIATANGSQQEEIDDLFGDDENDDAITNVLDEITSEEKTVEILYNNFIHLSDGHTGTPVQQIHGFIQSLLQETKGKGYNKQSLLQFIIRALREKHGGHYPCPACYKLHQLDENNYVFCEKVEDKIDVVQSGIPHAEELTITGVKKGHNTAIIDGIEEKVAAISDERTAADRALDEMANDLAEALQSQSPGLDTGMVVKKITQRCNDGEFLQKFSAKFSQGDYIEAIKYAASWVRDAWSEKSDEEKINEFKELLRYTVQLHAHGLPCWACHQLSGVGEHDVEWICDDPNCGEKNSIEQYLEFSTTDVPKSPSAAGEELTDEESKEFEKIVSKKQTERTKPFSIFGGKKDEEKSPYIFCRECALGPLPATFDICPECKGKTNPRQSVDLTKTAMYEVCERKEQLANCYKSFDDDDPRSIVGKLLCRCLPFITFLEIPEIVDMDELVNFYRLNREPFHGYLRKMNREEVFSNAFEKYMDEVSIANAQTMPGGFDSALVKQELEKAQTKKYRYVCNSCYGEKAFSDWPTAEEQICACGGNLFQPTKEEWAHLDAPLSDRPKTVSQLWEAISPLAGSDVVEPESLPSDVPQKTSPSTIDFDPDVLNSTVSNMTNQIESVPPPQGETEDIPVDSQSVEVDLYDGTLASDSSRIASEVNQIQTEDTESPGITPPERKAKTEKHPVLKPEKEATQIRARNGSANPDRLGTEAFKQTTELFHKFGKLEGKIEAKDQIINDQNKEIASLRNKLQAHSKQIERSKNHSKQQNREIQELKKTLEGFENRLTLMGKAIANLDFLGEEIKKLKEQISSMGDKKYIVALEDLRGVVEDLRDEMRGQNTKKVRQLESAVDQLNNAAMQDMAERLREGKKQIEEMKQLALPQLSQLPQGSTEVIHAHPAPYFPQAYPHYSYLPQKDSRSDEVSNFKLVVMLLCFTLIAGFIAHIIIIRDANKPYDTKTKTEHVEQKQKGGKK